MVRFTDVHDAFLYVSSGSYGERAAFLCPGQEQIVYAGGQELEEPLDEGIDLEDCLPIPHKNDLDLGRPLVFEFVDRYLPTDYDRVRRFFHNRGAYGRFKDFLARKGQLEAWFDFESRREEEALREWCREEGIDLAEATSPLSGKEIAEKEPYGLELLLDLKGCNLVDLTREKVIDYFVRLCDLIKMKRHGNPVFWEDWSGVPHLHGVSGVQFIETSNLVCHALPLVRAVYINIFSCREFDTQAAQRFSVDFWDAESVVSTAVSRT